MQNPTLNISARNPNSSSANQQAIQPAVTISAKKPQGPGTITLSTGSRLPKKTGEVKEPVRRKAAPKVEDGIPTVYIAGGNTQSAGNRREVIPSRQVEESGEPEVKNMIESVLDDLDHAIDNKIQEYNDFCQALIEEDAINRAMLTEEQIAAEVKDPSEDPLDKGNFSEAEIPVEEAFKEQELDPMEVAMGVGKENTQKDYTLYKKNKSIFDTSKETEIKELPKKEEIPQVIPETPIPPVFKPKADLPFVVEEKSDGTKVQGEYIEDAQERMTDTEPEFPKLDSAVAHIPNDALADFFVEESTEEKSDKNSTDFEQVEKNIPDKTETHSSNNHETLDELMSNFEINEEDRLRMEEIKETMTLSPEDRAKLAMAQKMKEQEAVMATQREKVDNPTTLGEKNDFSNVVKMEVDPNKALDEIPADVFADIDDEDFKDLDMEEDEETESENPFEDEHMKELQKDISSKIKIVADKVDLNTLSIAKQPISYQKALEKEETNERVTDWVLMASNRHIAFTPFSGVQLEKINPNSAGRNALNSIRTQWQEIYEHVVDPYKPATLEQWAKTVRYLDIENIYFGIYVSNFMDSNFIPYTCEHCKTMFLSDNMNILDMLKYKNDEAKEKFRRLYDAEPSPASAEYPTEIVLVSDNIAVQIKNPSIYDVLFETASLDTKFREKYEQIIALMVYIDGMYYIDRANNNLIPIAVKQYPSNMAKSVKSKIITYAKILNSLKADSYSILQAYIRQMVDKEDELKFQIPEVTCTKCGTVIPKEERTAVSILFTRHQLAALATM